MSSISSTSAISSELQSYRVQQYVARPRASLKDSSDDDDLKWFEVKEIVQRISGQFFTREELACIGFRLKEARPNASSFFSPQQLEAQKKIEELCQGINSAQLSPLRILYAAIIEKFAEAQALSQKFEGYALQKGQKKSLKDLMDEKFEEFFCTFAAFQHYFIEGDDGIFDDCKKAIELNILPFLISLRDAPHYKIGESSRSKDLFSWLSPLIEHMAFLTKCMNSRKELFPFTLRPLASEAESRSFLSPEIIKLLRNFSRGAAFGCKLAAKKFDETIKNSQSNLSSVKATSIEKRFYGVFLKEFEQIRKESIELSESIEKFASSSALARLEKKLKTKGRTSHLAEQDIFSIISELSSKSDEITNKYLKILSDFTKWGEKVSSKFENSRNMLSEANQLKRDLSAHFDLLIANSFFYMGIVKDGLLGRYQKEAEKNARMIERLKADLPQDKSANSFFINQGDRLFSYLLEQTLKLYSTQLSTNSNQIVQILIGKVGVLKDKLSSLTNRSLALASQDRGAKEQIAEICYTIETIKCEIPFFENELKKSNFEPLKKILCCLQDSLIQDARENGHFQFFPLYGFLIEPSSDSSMFNGGLLRFFNAQLKMSKQVAQKANFKILGFIVDEEERRDKDFPAVLNEVCEASSSNLQLLLEVQKTILGFPDLKSEEDCLRLAGELMAFQEKFFSQDRLHDKESEEWLEKVRQFFLHSNQVRVIVNEGEAKPSEEGAQYVVKKLLETSEAFNSYFLLHHLPLLRWAKETLLFPSSPKKKKEVKRTIPPSEVHLEIPEEKEIIPASSSSAASLQTPMSEDDSPFQTGIAEQIHHLKRMGLPRISMEEGERALMRQEQLSSGVELIEGVYLPVLERHKFLPSFFSAETALLYSALSVEQALKYRLARLFPSRYFELRASHELTELLKASQLKEPFSEEELHSVKDASDIIHKSSRYLWGVRGVSAGLLRQFAANRATSMHLDEAKRISCNLLSSAEKVLASITQEKGGLVQAFSEISSSKPSILSIEEKAWLEEVDKYLKKIEVFLKQLEISHLGSPGNRICIGNTSEGSHPFRERQIIKSFKDSSYYLQGIREVLPSFFDEEFSYAQTNFIFMKLSLLLEQNLHALIAYLDIPSAKNPSIHALLEEVGRGKSARPRSHDHNIKEAFLILEAFLGEELLQLPKPEKEHIFSLSNFLGRIHRYLSGEEKGEVAACMLELKDLSFALGKRRFDCPEKVKRLKREIVYPKILGVLKAAEKILQFSLRLRTKR